MKLISLLPINIREAEKEEKPADDAEGGDENPFAASDDAGEDTGAEEEADDTAKDGGDEEKDGADSTEESKPLDVVFNPTRVKKYNDIKFSDNKGSVTAISRFGLTVKLPDDQTIFVNFEDIL